MGNDRDNVIPSSFRDPSGYLFFQDGLLYRNVNNVYMEHYDHLMGSGLYKRLTENGMLVAHEEVDMAIDTPPDVYKTIRPEEIPFISYPYEWCFSQLKDAALTTLEIQKIALEFDMSLKDASAYNIQFRKGKPILIDSLSFEKYREEAPWVAYRQFCQHFLAPLALMSRKDVRLGQLFRIYIDGAPLDLASELLPAGSRLSFGLLSHIHLHAKSQKRYSDKSMKGKAEGKVSRLGFRAIIDSLESAVRKLKWTPAGMEWSDYYDDTNYSAEASANKAECLRSFLEIVRPKRVWDIGANTGVFSRIAGDLGIPTISFDLDPSAVEKNYLECVQKDEVNILPLILDLTNPSPGVGWENEERASFMERGPVDMAFALALIHHLAISNNLPLNMIARFFSRICKWLVIEFIPKSDSQVQRLLQSREDIFRDYTQENFEKEFKDFFSLDEKREIEKSQRTLYLMRKDEC